MLLLFKSNRKADSVKSKTGVNGHKATCMYHVGKVEEMESDGHLSKDALNVAELEAESSAFSSSVDDELLQ